MLPLLVALAAPLVGALIYLLLHHHPRTVQLVDTATVVVLPVLIALQVLPHAWEERTIWPVVAVGAGLGLLALIERISHDLTRHTDNLTIVLGVLGLALHAGLEGSALTPGAPMTFLAPVAVHRITIGLVIWWLLQPRHGTAAAAAGLGVVIVATLAGFFVSSELLASVDFLGGETFQAFVSGSLMHVVLHQGRHDHRH